MAGLAGGRAAWLLFSHSLYGICSGKITPLNSPEAGSTASVRRVWQTAQACFRADARRRSGVNAIRLTIGVETTSAKGPYTRRALPVWSPITNAPENEASVPRLAASTR